MKVPVDHHKQEVETNTSS